MTGWRLYVIIMDRITVLYALNLKWFHVMYITYAAHYNEWMAKLEYCKSNVFTELDK